MEVRILFLALALVGLLGSTNRGAEPVRFNRDVLPILADKCFQCHGPDSARRKADLRFDREENARPKLKEVLSRITSKDAQERMPPKGSGRELASAQIDTLQRWIAEGAIWEKHWAFNTPKPSTPPAVKDDAWPRSAIDRFILARLEKEGLRPSPEADRHTLIRRMSFDLTGIPPAPEEVDRFVNERSPDAVERLVDRLLASPRYGERMAWRWLEAARYADTNGYQTDAERFMWRWRDWVIEAYNRNLPFDQFTIEQIAGDLLPAATLDQRIATGFNRNHRGNGEGGIIPEEYAAEYVADRVETTATVWLGLTLGCARCHDHKFDPFSQKEFYQLFAFFNNVPEHGKAAKHGNSVPIIKAPTREQIAQLSQLDLRMEEAKQQFAGLHQKALEAQARWEKSVDADQLPNWSPDRGLVRPDRLKFHAGDEAFTKGRVGNAIDLDGKRYAEAGNLGDFGFDDKFTLAFWIYPRTSTGAIVSRMVGEPNGAGYSVHLVDGKIQAHFTVRWLDDAMRIETKQTLATNQWHHVAVCYDGSRLAKGVKVHIDGQDVSTSSLLDELNQSFQTKEPIRIGRAGSKDNQFDGLIDDFRIYHRVIDAQEARIIAVPAALRDIITRSAAKRTEAEKEKLKAYFLGYASPPAVRRAYRAVHEAREARDKFYEAIPTVMVMEEMPKPRDTFVLLRGQYDRLGEKVKATTPATLQPLATSRTPNRLDLAKWLVSPDNPLTARVAVNRMWQLHFGTGLVRTAEDFGTQGEFPSHPELLDWLATEFMRMGWDVKKMHKLIVTSAVYRQSSRLPIDENNRQSTIGNQQSTDPDNRLLSRFPRNRLSAEMIRDQALFASSLLVEQQGGPSVKPYQPAGLWNELSGAGDYVPDKGKKLYRRGLYTFWKRTVAPPMLATFDAAGRETCWVRESRTNTPLQALTLLNETSFVEASRKLAERVMNETKAPEERLTLAFRRIVSRPPSDAEMVVLRRTLGRHLDEFRENADSAKKLLSVGESKADPKLDVSELASYAAVCRLILNLDEAVTRE